MREPIGVLHLANSFAADGAAAQLLARLRAHPDGFRPVVACLRKVGPLAGAVALPVEEFRVDEGTVAAAVVRLAAFIEREGARLVHANDYYANLVAVPAAKMVRARVVCSRLDLRQWAFRAQRIAEAVALSGADATMVNARCIRERCIRDDGVPADRVYVVHNGVDLARFGPPAPDARPTVAVLANLHASKGHLDLLEAVALLRARVPEVQVLCAGEGPMRAVLRQQIALLGLEGSVALPGRVGDVPALLARAHVACSPSHDEGFSSAIAEAMAASLPVVATEVGGTPELVQHGETGLLAPPRDPRALADRLLALLRDPPLAQRLGAEGRRRAEAELALPALSKRLGELYRAVLARDERPRRAA